MIQSLASPMRISNDCWGARLEVFGSGSRCETYRRRLAPPPTERPAPDGTLQLRVELADKPPAPPSGAVVTPFGRVHEAVAYAADPAGWHSFQRTGPGRWRLVRPANSTRLVWEPLWLPLAALRGGALPLDASVGRLDDQGWAAIGAANSGKTAVLLSLLLQGGEWVGDDLVFCDLKLQAVWAGSSDRLHVKHAYVSQLPPGTIQIPRKDRWRLRRDRVARWTAGVAARLHAPGRDRLRRIARGQSRIALAPAGRIDHAEIHTAALVCSGDEYSCEPLPSDEWSRRAAALLEGELFGLHEADRQLRAATGESLLDGDIEQDRLRLAARLEQFAADKRTCQLMRPPQSSLEKLTSLMQSLDHPR